MKNSSELVQEEIDRLNEEAEEAAREKVQGAVAIILHAQKSIATLQAAIAEARKTIASVTYEQVSLSTILPPSP